MTDSYEDLIFTPTDDFKAFAKEYVEEAGSSIEDVEFKKGPTLQSVFDLTGYICLRTEQSELGYELFEFEDTETHEKVLVMLDIMSGNWISVT